MSKLKLDSESAGPSSVISDLKEQLKEQKVTANPGYEIVFSFKYHGKPVTLRMAIERSADSYIDDSYLKVSDLVILHDLVDSAEEERIVTRALQYPRDANAFHTNQRKDRTLESSADLGRGHPSLALALYQRQLSKTRSVH